jgi:4-hydroxybenzoate polyprenyltransferase
MLNVSPYIKLIRPSNWIKNLIIGFPFLLSGNFDIDTFLKCVVGFICFSLLASGGYIINDIRDIGKDRMHARKRNRPLANGSVKVDRSFILAGVLISSAFIINLYFGFIPFLILLAYFSLNYFYSIYGKRMRFMDIILLSSFYIIRVMYGSEICDIPLTGWFMATLTFSVLALSINKRYMECRMTTKERIPGRGYTREDQAILYQLMFNFTTATIVLLNIHAFFVLSISSSYFYFLLNLAAAGIVFFYFDYSKIKSEDPVERILKNKKLLLLLLMFVALYTYEVIIKTK